MIFTKTVDARDYKPNDKHIVIFETFDSLGKGEKMELINDHDPKPLYYQFQAERQGFFNWEYIEEGPEVWRVAITKNFANE
ncbi:MAG: DUF2249 domain-containing protein [Tissierellia bacterium]|nr:DUF2249 domain-containing protein [Tissierellia bacterium]MDD4726585.1 DUF2249 domain-containing protein [Tissierellia bacterium]